MGSSGAGGLVFWLVLLLGLIGAGIIIYKSLGEDNED